jgi:hypothetical protein
MIDLAPAGGYPMHVAEPFALAQDLSLQMEPNALTTAPMETRNDPPGPTESEMVCVNIVEESMRQEFRVATFGGHGKWWVDVNHLRSDVKAMGEKYGFKVRTQGAQLV